MKRSLLAFALVLTLATSGLYAVDESPIGRLLGVVKVWILDDSLADADDPLVKAIESGATGTHNLEGVKDKGQGPREYWTITITKRDTPLPPVPVPPGPQPTPSPTLQGFALEVFNQARLLPATDCRRLAANYETTATMIAAGGIRDTLTANAKLTELNKALALSPATWTTFAQWLGGKFNEQAQTLEATKKLLNETATGLNAAGAR